jgi:dihydrolipoamide dehydrogenase
MNQSTFDAIVIGGGPGGYVAAIRLGQLGLKALLVEKEYLGGVCLNWGCIPSKALITAAELVHKIRQGQTMGITVADLKVDLGKTQAWKDGIVRQLTGGVQSLVKSNGGQIVMGTGRLTGANQVSVFQPNGTTETYTATKGIILATGARPMALAGFEIDGKVVITAREAMSLVQMPQRLVLIGGGAIGMEIGMAYQKLGAKVSVVEMMDQLLPGLDADLAAVVQRRFQQAGGEVLLQANASGCRVHGAEATVTVTQGGQTREIKADKVLVAAGFQPNSEGLGLESLGIARDSRGHVRTDERFCTTQSSVFAIGDLCGPPYLAHKASKEGEIAAEVIAGMKSERDWRALASAFFTDPEIATVGLTEAQAKKEGRKVKIGKFPFSASGRAKTANETDGFVKTIVDAQEGQVLGVGIVGPRATDLIGEAALSIEMCALAEDVASTVHPHPTLCEAIMESFKHVDGAAIHILNRR